LIPDDRNTVMRPISAPAPLPLATFCPAGFAFAKGRPTHRASTANGRPAESRLIVPNFPLRCVGIVVTGGSPTERPV
jgi:hypothetical protein